MFVFKKRLDTVFCISSYRIMIIYKVECDFKYIFNVLT